MDDQGQLWTPVKDPLQRPTMTEILSREWNGRRAVGTFSGCGGSSLGLRMAGWKVPYAVEFIPEAAKTYSTNFTDTYVNRHDIRSIEGDDILMHLNIERGDLDLLEGSPPCSSFSVAGTREKDWGKVKKYSDSAQQTDDLFWEWARLVEELRPKTILAENVPGMLMGRALEEYTQKILALLSDQGYIVNMKVMNSVNFGVPQERRRVIFIGIRRDLSKQMLEFPQPTCHEPYTVREALDTVTNDDPEHIEDSSMEGYAVGRTWHEIIEAKQTGRIPKFDICERCEEPLVDHPQREHSETSGKVTKAQCHDGEPAVITKEYFMLVVPDPDKPCPTVTATMAQAGAASVTHPTECRKFTPAELLAISGFPPDFQLTGSRQQQCERIGRTVTPPLYEAVGKSIAQQLTEAEEMNHA